MACDPMDERYEDEELHGIDWDFDPTPGCPICSGPGVILGGLGSLMHYRCRNCGMGFHSPATHTHQEAQL